MKREKKKIGKSDRKRRNRSFLIAASEDIACDTYIWRLCLLASVAQLSILPFLDHDWKRRIVLDLKPLPSQWCGIVEKSLRNRSNWPNCGRRKKGEANNRIRPLGSKRTEELKLRQAREANNFCLRWTASRDRVRFQIVGVKVVVAFVAGAPFSSTVSNVAIRGRGELILSAQKSPASKPVEEKQRERKRNGRRNPTIRYFASLARPLVYPWKPRKISCRIFDGILPYRSSSLSLSLSFSSAEITRKQRAGDRMKRNTLAIKFQATPRVYWLAFIYPAIDRAKTGWKGRDARA